MTLRAYSAEQLRALEFALEGKPPEDGAKQAYAELDRYALEHLECRKANGER
jgi:hypothetical protein